MSVLDGSEVRRLNCHNVMQVDIHGEVMPVNITARDAMTVNIQGAVMRVELCWPDIDVQQVMHNGQPLMVDGEPVYLLVPS